MSIFKTIFGDENTKAFKKANLSLAVVMVSALTKAGATTTMKALELGALDFITKPDTNDMEQNKRDIINNNMNNNGMNSPMKEIIPSTILLFPARLLIKKNIFSFSNPK